MDAERTEKLGWNKLSFFVANIRACLEGMKEVDNSVLYTLNYYCKRNNKRK